MFSNRNIILLILVLVVVAAIFKKPTVEGMTLQSGKDNYTTLSRYNLFQGVLPRIYNTINGDFVVGNNRVLLKDGMLPENQKVDLKGAKNICNELGARCVGFNHNASDETTIFYSKLGLNDITNGVSQLRDDNTVLYAKNLDIRTKDVDACPNRLVAPNCPEGLLPCNDDKKYCYNPKTNEMVSTYMTPEYDYCPELDTGKKDGSKPKMVNGVRVWARKQGKDKSCKNLEPQVSCDYRKSLGGKTCNGWSWIDTRVQHWYGLPQNIPPVYPDEFCWDQSIRQCRRKRANDTTN